MILLVYISINRVVTHFVLVNEREVFELEHTFEKKKTKENYINYKFCHTCLRK